MKKFLLIPFLATTLALPLIGSDKSAQGKPTTPAEPKMLDQVLADYRAGSYNSFLKKSDDNYRDAEKKWKNNELLKQRKKLSTIIPDHRIDKTDEFKQKIAALHHAQDQELIEAALNHPNEKIITLLGFLDNFVRLGLFDRPSFPMAFAT